MWLICFTVLLVVLAVTWRTAGPQRAVGYTVGLTLIVPTWITHEFWGLPVGIPIAAGMAALGAYCLHPRAVFKARLGLIDWSLLGLVLVQLGSDWAHQGFNWSVPLLTYGEWFVPYVAGRLAVRSPDEARALLPVMVAVVIWFAIVSTIQGLSGVNLAELVFGAGQIDEGVDKLSRWGIHRAYGSLKNPNYFGVLQLLLVPWSVYAAALAWSRLAPSWWLALPWLSAAGVLFPMSRAAQGGLVLALFVTKLLKSRRRQLIAPAIIAAMFACLVWQSQNVITAVDAWSGDLRSWNSAPASRSAKIKIGKKEHHYSGTALRLHVFELYGAAMRKCGLLGFGTEATNQFPVNVPIGQQDLLTLKRMWTVDNTFLLVGLRLGYLGLACFVAWSIAIAGTWCRLALVDKVTPELKTFASAMAGVSIAMLFVFLTVWMPHDFGFCYIWTAGICAGLNEGLQRSADGGNGRQRISPTPPARQRPFRPSAAMSP